MMKKTKNTEIVTQEQIKVFMNFMEQNNQWSMYLPLVSLLITTGLRYGEAMGLTWEDVDLKNKTVDVNKNMNCKNGHGQKEFYLSAPKTKECTRVVNIDDDMVEMFKKQKVYRRAMNLSKEVFIDGKEGWIFTDEDGYPITSKEFLCILEKMINDANVWEEQQSKNKCREPIIIGMMRPHVFRQVWTLNK